MSVTTELPRTDALRLALGRFFLVEGAARLVVAMVLWPVYPEVAWGGLLAVAGSWALYGIHRTASCDTLVLAAGVSWATYFLAAFVIFGWDTGFYQQTSCMVFAVFLFGHIKLRVRIQMAVVPLMVMAVVIPMMSGREPLIMVSHEIKMGMVVGNLLLSTTLNAAILIHFIRGLFRERRRLAELANSRQHLIEALSHELKTPIAAMLTQTQVALRADEDSEGKSKVLELIERNLRGMTTLTSRMLDISRLQRGDLAVERRKVSPSALLQASVALHEPLATSRGVSLIWKSDREAMWQTDPDLLQVALDNLVSNAIRYSPAGGRVKIEAGGIVGPDPESTGWIVVKDEGAGIAVAEQERIFEPLFRGDSSRSRKEGSHGLGLSIAQRAVHALGGTIEVKSTVGQGAQFTIRL